MPGIKFATTAPAEVAIKTAYRTAQDLGYSVQEAGSLRLRARRGNVALRAPRARAPADDLLRLPALRFRKYDRDNELIIEWASIWWTGFVGARQDEKRLAAKLLESIGDALEASEHFKCPTRREF